MSFYKTSNFKITNRNIVLKLSSSNIVPKQYQNCSVKNNLLNLLSIIRGFDNGEFQLNYKFETIEKAALILTLKKITRKRRKSNYEITIKDAENFYKTLNRLKKIKEKNEKYIIVDNKGIEAYVYEIYKGRYRYVYDISYAKRMKLETLINFSYYFNMENKTILKSR